MSNVTIYTCGWGRYKKNNYAFEFCLTVLQINTTLINSLMNSSLGNLYEHKLPVITV